MYNYSFANIVYARDTKNGELSCFYCSRSLSGDNFPIATVDHLWPDSSGGSSRPCNLVTACHSCNSKRGVLIPDCVSGKNISEWVTGSGNGKYIILGKRGRYKTWLKNKVNSLTAKAVKTRSETVDKMVKGKVLEQERYRELLDE